MIRKFRTLGLGLLAICALGALGASSASANFDAEVEHVSLEGNQTVTNVFTTAIGKVECKKAKFTGTNLSGTAVAGGFTSSDITVAALYTECTAFGFAAEVKMNGCEYTMTRTGKDASGVPIGPVHILCPGTNKIQIITGVCNMEVGPQTPGGHVSYKNEGAGKTRDVLVTATVTGIVYTSNCGNGNGGTYNGAVTTKGFNTAGEQVGVWVT